MNYDDRGDTGYLLSVNLSYPQELHAMHKHFPLAPHTVEINFKDMSPYAKKAHLNAGGKSNFKSQKLIASCLPRNDYILNINNLKLYLQLGLKLEKINKILQFKQEPFLKPYIEMCTKKRQEAPNKFKKNLFKLMANSGNLQIIIHYIPRY